MDALASYVALVLRSYLALAFVLVLPAGLCCLVLRALERFMVRRLGTSFGRAGIAVTAWIGTPIHELSHAAACLVFRHRITKIELYEPDPRSGTAGRVRHSFRESSFYQAVLGNAVIGLAPFAGGALAIHLATWLLASDALARGPAFPEVAVRAFAEPALLGEAALAVLTYSLGTLACLASPERLADWRAWVHLPLVTSIACHLSPSREDFEHVRRPAPVLALVLLGATAALVLAFAGWPGRAIDLFVRVARAVTGVLAFAVLLSALASAAVALVTGLWQPRRRWISRGRMC